ncbi:MAG TPA: M15 family metallopeptidase [Gemmatimonadaceae bacterium]
MRYSLIPHLALAIGAAACASPSSRSARAGAGTSAAPAPTPAPAATAAGRAAYPTVNTADLPVAPDSVARRLLVDVHDVDSTIIVRLRYATSDNFTGAPIPGYEANRALLRREVAEALARVQHDLAGQGLSLEIFDAYRPVRASEAMVAWTERVHRQDLLRDGYIASHSRHNLGVTVDLTLADRATGRELDMGTPFDTFSPAAHTANASGVAAANRTKLLNAMAAEGFINYDQEWWHFTYEVPNPLRFDLVIR